MNRIKTIFVISAACVALLHSPFNQDAVAQSDDNPTVEASSSRKVLNGAEAIEALGPKINELAERMGYQDPKELEKLFLTDSTLHVDLSHEMPMLLYVDKAPVLPPPVDSTDARN